MLFAVRRMPRCNAVPHDTDEASAHRRVSMRAFARALRLWMAMALACAMAGLPSCASMGGGMKYASPEPALAADCLVTM
jgi:hypothetical protein